MIDNLPGLTMAVFQSEQWLIGEQAKFFGLQESEKIIKQM
jgi:hypothetical protein